MTTSRAILVGFTMVAAALLLVGLRSATVADNPGK